MARSRLQKTNAGGAVLLQEPISTMQDMIVAKLRDAIMKGALQPGERISERSITEKMGISKTPVREALTHLEAEGWVQIFPYRGAVVSPLSVAELEDIYVIRIALEGTAARLAARNIDAATMRTLGDIVTRMAKTRGDDELMALNRRFHDLFFQQSGRPLLCNLIGTYQDKSVRYRRLLQGLTNSKRRIAAERRALLRACGKEPPGVIERMVQDNLNRNLQTLRGLIIEMSGSNVVTMREAAR